MSGAEEGTRLERAYLEEIRDEQLLRVRWGIAAASAFDAALIVLAPLAFRGWDVDGVRNAELGGLVAMLAAFACTYLPRCNHYVVLLLGLLSASIALAVGYAAVATGGYASHMLYIIMLIWMFGAAIAPLSVGQFVKATWFDVPIAFAVVHVESGAGVAGGAVAPLSLFGGAYVYCLVGTFLRFRGDVAAYADRQRLAAAKRALEASDAQLRSLNDDLGRQVAVQVDEIVARAREVDVLNAQLKLRVQERSRELANALRRLGEKPLSGEVPLPGMRIGDRFELVELLGEGGMGSVHLGRDLHTGATVAIKTIRHHGKDVRTLQRLILEATSATRVTHPGIVRTLDVDVTAGGTLYLILEYVDGMALDRRMGLGPLPCGHACRIGAVLADALAAVHAAGVVHRDIKPSNILLCRAEPGIKLLDFGIAKVLETQDGHETHIELTKTDQILGTPKYLAPEQASDPDLVGPAVDVYALAMIVFEMVTGQLPLQAAGALQWFVIKNTTIARDLRDLVRDAPLDLAEVLGRALAKDPAQRPSAVELCSALNRIADREQAPHATQLALPQSKAV